MQDILNSLNKVQQEAVTTTEGPLLVLAGAGTGKTKVLTSRVAYIIKQNLARPFEILAVTFTNKAASEMKERIASLAGDLGKDLWVGTFHSICLRILRRFYEAAGLKSNFIILDTEDSQKVLKQIMVDLNIDIKTTPVRLVASLIAKLKDKVIFPEDVPYSENNNLGGNNIRLSQVYKEYNQKLKDLNAVDFNDLLLLCVKIFKEQPEILEFYQKKFKYILVDEYQDTNILQYQLLKMLALKNGNICCVGDDDQSIYSWRGAEIANILSFNDTFKDAKILRLEENYRSTTQILETASAVIANNGARWGKTLWTSKQDGQKIIIHECVDSNSEAKLIATEIARFYRDGFNYNEIAILVRAGYQTREIEENLLKEHIPYKIIGSNKFYERLEIKDALAYLRLCFNLSDNLAFERIINVPKRGIGAKALEKIREVAGSYKLSYFAAVELMLQNQAITGKVVNELQNFVTQIHNWRNQIEKTSLTELTEKILEESGYLAMWRDERTEESKMRLENLIELLNSLSDFNSLEEYLEHVSLIISVDDLNEDNKVSLMTLHAAKGLEFHVVFLSGWEEGIFPSARSIDETGEKGLEEERRLAYVGITRAKEKLIVSYSKRRVTFGSWQDCMPSRFIKEMGTKHIEFKKQQAFDSTWSYEGYNKRSGFKENYQEKSFNSHPYWNNSSSKSFSKTIGFNKGEKVKHQSFGVGIVKKQEGPLLYIDFESHGEKKIMADFVSKV